jgi:hypothetical protein
VKTVRTIDAEHLRNRLKTETNPYGKPTLDYESGLKILHMIDEEATVYASPKEGTWLKHGNGKTCSLCEFTYYSNGNEWNFCPKCGAKMKGDTDAAIL